MWLAFLKTKTSRFHIFILYCIVISVKFLIVQQLLSFIITLIKLLIVAFFLVICTLMSNYWLSILCGRVNPLVVVILKMFKNVLVISVSTLYNIYIFVKCRDRLIVKLTLYTICQPQLYICTVCELICQKGYPITAFLKIKYTIMCEHCYNDYYIYVICFVVLSLLQLLIMCAGATRKLKGGAIKRNKCLKGDYYQTLHRFIFIYTTQKHLTLNIHKKTPSCCSKAVLTQIVRLNTHVYQYAFCCRFPSDQVHYYIHFYSQMHTLMVIASVSNFITTMLRNDW